MATYAESGAEAVSAEAIAGEWERQFIDDLVASNRLKTFLVSQGIELPKDVLEGLAGLSEKFQGEIDQFTRDQRSQLESRSWRRRLFPVPSQ